MQQNKDILVIISIFDIMTGLCSSWTKTWGGVVLAGVVERVDGEGAGLMELQLKFLF